MNAVYERMMDGHKPARTTVQAGALPMKGLRVEIDAIAYKKASPAISVDPLEGETATV